MVNQTVHNTSLSIPDVGQPLANAAKADSSILDTWSKSDAQNFSMEALSDFVLSEPFEVTGDLEQDNSILATLPGDIFTNNSQDALA